MRTVIIVQARMTSSRLPGKVLMDVGGRPMLAQELRRLQRCEGADEIVVATTTNATDDPVVALADEESVRWFRGPEGDVLSRYVGAAREAGAEVVVRVTGDCPIIDAGVTDRVIHDAITHSAECDYSSNVLVRTFPRGLDTEVLFGDALLRLGRMAQTAAEREHVTAGIYSRPHLFAVRSVTDSIDNSDLRWTVDTVADLRLMRALYEVVDISAGAPYFQILSYVRTHSELQNLNADVVTWEPVKPQAW
jgi:spore coat polysaccharide biosynthesis protein SpsF